MTVVDNSGRQNPHSVATVRNLVEKAAAMVGNLIEQAAATVENLVGYTAATVGELVGYTAGVVDNLVDHTAGLVEYTESLRRTPILGIDHSTQHCNRDQGN
ncbi:hypothetical protein BASA81_016862 [Batrachochytrium salamandrivorans]|nr:hypothetical protein BASA81_016862 [Batrachochytrium salamandrivorans]